MIHQHFLLFSLSLSFATMAQSVGVGTTAPNASAALDVTSTTGGGLLLPRLLPLLAALAITTWALVNYTGHLSTDGYPGLPTAVAASLGPLVFVAFIIAGVVLTVRYFGQFRRPAVAWYLLLTYGALGWLAAVLGAYGWMSLRLWTV